MHLARIVASTICLASLMSPFNEVAGRAGLAESGASQSTGTVYEQPPRTVQIPLRQLIGRTEAESLFERAVGPILRTSGSRLALCELDVQEVHLRLGRGSVGFKPLTTCSVPVTSIHHRSKLTYRFLLEWRQAGPEWKGDNVGQRKLYSKGLEYRCRGTRETQWRGTTLVAVVYEAQTYYGVATTPIRTLPCSAWHGQSR